MVNLGKIFRKHGVEILLIFLAVVLIFILLSIVL